MVKVQNSEQSRATKRRQKPLDNVRAAAAESGAKSAHPEPARNPGTSLHLNWVAGLRINQSAVERRINSLPARRGVKYEAQVAFMLTVMRCIDLTTLQGDDTLGRVQRLAAKARQPLNPSILAAYGLSAMELHTAAICVYHEMTAAIAQQMKDGPVAVAAVSAGFPAGLTPFVTRLEDIRQSVLAGADEIDVVVSRRHVLSNDWQALYEEVRAFKEACGSKLMKTILATGEHDNLTQTAKASMVAMMAGSDFIKTSTGMEAVNANLPVALVMVRAIRDFYQRTGYRVGFKPAGGIRTAKEAVLYLILMKEELGKAWLHPSLFRIGASGLLGDLEQQLEFHATGRYSVAYHHSVT